MLQGRPNGQGRVCTKRELLVKYGLFERHSAKNRRCLGFSHDLARNCHSTNSSREIKPGLHQHSRNCNRGPSGVDRSIESNSPLRLIDSIASFTAERSRSSRALSKPSTNARLGPYFLRNGQYYGDDIESNRIKIRVI